jgi:uncharacterized RDD family membrane protein YckC
MDENVYQATQTQPTAAVPPTLAWSNAPPLDLSAAYAGFWRRFLALCIDGFVVMIFWIPLSTLLDALVERVPAEVTSTDVIWLALIVWVTAGYVLLIAMDWLYYAALESSSWQATVGKHALGIAVTDVAGNRISFGRATGRHFARFVSVITLGIGYLIQPFTARRQALHDVIAGTVVVRH